MYLLHNIFVSCSSYNKQRLYYTRLKNFFVMASLIFKFAYVHECVTFVCSKCNLLFVASTCTTWAV